MGAAAGATTSSCGGVTDTDSDGAGVVWRAVSSVVFSAVDEAVVGVSLCVSSARGSSTAIRSTDPGALTSSRTPATAAAVCSVCFAALVRAGVRLAGVRAVVDFVVEVRAVVVLAPAALVAGFAAAGRAVVDLGVFGAVVVSADSVLSAVPAAAADFAGVRFAAVVRAVVDLVAVVFAAEVRVVVERAVVVLGAGVVASPDSPEVSLADVVRVRGVLGRFAGAFAVPVARGVVERGARFGAVGAAEP
ncbi:hypothetical protein [Plantibacter elymi (nom. nud.)]|uniref:hypothetical protein n=1 Tax=Plantibacter elymi (nom. nud.) TaxID=199708 RepID=UPI0013FDD4FC|nr:hypothetical protein [Plantibacter sp. VKM Ac-1784]